MLKSNKKRTLYSWFIKRFVMPRLQVIDSPGFVIFRISKKTGRYSRQVIFPESVCVDIENNFGENICTRIGKSFGQIFAQISNLSKVSEISSSDFVRYVDIVTKFVEGTYADNINSTLDYKNETIHFDMENFIVCNKNGKGYLFSTGGISGIWSYMVEDIRVEAYQPLCQGRGDPKCVVISGPYKILKEKYGYTGMRYKCYTEINEIDTYLSINSLKKTKYSNISLKNLIDSNFVNFTQGKILLNNERFFICESHFIYLLEKYLSTSKNNARKLWNICYEFGKKLWKTAGVGHPAKFIMDLFSAFGYGDVFVFRHSGNYDVIFYSFPWTEYVDDIEYIIIRAILSGIFSQAEQKDISLENFDIATKDTFVLRVY